ncbi:hypothetical protein [Bifidobacterium apri]|nr:hypothetical protein [Bifidobacterium apri]
MPKRIVTVMPVWLRRRYGGDDDNDNTTTWHTGKGDNGDKTPT